MLCFLCIEWSYSCLLCRNSCFGVGKLIWHSTVHLSFDNHDIACKTKISSWFCWLLWPCLHVNFDHWRCGKFDSYSEASQEVCVLMVPVRCDMWHAISHMSHVACHMSLWHVACDMSLVTCHMSHEPGTINIISINITRCDMPHVTCHLWHATCDMPHVICHMWHATCDMLHVTCHMRHATRNMPHSRRDMPHATCSMSGHILDSFNVTWLTSVSDMFYKRVRHVLQVDVAVCVETHADDAGHRKRCDSPCQDSFLSHAYIQLVPAAVYVWNVLRWAVYTRRNPVRLQMYQTAHNKDQRRRLPG